MVCFNRLTTSSHSGFLTSFGMTADPKEREKRYHALRSPVRDKMWVENEQIPHHALRSPVRDEILVEKSNHKHPECPVRDMIHHEYCVPNGTLVFVGTSIFYPHQIPNGINH